MNDKFILKSYFVNRFRFMDKTKIIIFAVIGLVVIIIGAVVLINPSRPVDSAPVTLDFWSVFDNSDIYQPVS